MSLKQTKFHSEFECYKSHPFLLFLALEDPVRGLPELLPYLFLACTGSLQPAKLQVEDVLRLSLLAKQVADGALESRDAKSWWHSR